jgi:hypothetical protein
MPNVKITTTYNFFYTYEGISGIDFADMVKELEFIWIPNEMVGIRTIDIRDFREIEVISNE